MREIILEELRKIEEVEKVKIIMAVESGSRAWGFASPDSDYDVRFIYVRKPEDYLKLEGNRDVIEWKLDEVLDINGWDLRKALRLLYKSNPTIFEWSASPIVYWETEDFKKLKKLLPRYFSMKKSLYHYRSMAERTYIEHLQGEEVKAKKYFYSMRPLLAAKWILDKKCAPPMLFEELMEAELEEILKPEVNNLLKIKKNLTETGMVKKKRVIDEYIEKSILEIEKIAGNMENETVEWKPLNDLFLEMIQW